MIDYFCIRKKGLWGWLVLVALMVWWRMIELDCASLHKTTPPQRTRHEIEIIPTLGNFACFRNRYRAVWINLFSKQRSKLLNQARRASLVWQHVPCVARARRDMSIPCRKCRKRTACPKRSLSAAFVRQRAAFAAASAVAFGLGELRAASSVATTKNFASAK